VASGYIKVTLPYRDFYFRNKEQALFMFPANILNLPGHAERLRMALKEKIRYYGRK
jgi:hypothetical protein